MKSIYILFLLVMMCKCFLLSLTIQGMYLDLSVQSQQMPHNAIKVLNVAAATSAVQFIHSTKCMLFFFLKLLILVGLMFIHVYSSSLCSV